MLTPGSLFAGRYRIERAIAKGGMGAVYEVVHLETDRVRALKVMHDGALESPELRQRFRREARVTSKIESEFIVEVFDAGIDDESGVPFLVMEMLRGEDLGQRLKRAGRFSAADTVTYLSQTARALDKTHAAAIVHRDLKPANLFLTTREDGSPRVKILDFGIAKLVAEGETQGGTSSLGTPLYMAPEQFRGSGKVSAQADVYALGLIAYSFLVGRPYWEEERRQAENLIAFALEIVAGPVEAPSARAARREVTLPPKFDAWFMRAVAPEAKNRFPRAGEAIMALGEALGVPIDLPPPSNAALAPPSEDSIDVVADEPSAATVLRTSKPIELRAEAKSVKIDEKPLEEATGTQAGVTRASAPGRRRSKATSLLAMSALVGVGVAGTIAVSHWTAARDAAANGATSTPTATPTATPSSTSTASASPHPNPPAQAGEVASADSSASAAPRATPAPAPPAGKAHVPATPSASASAEAQPEPEPEPEAEPEPQAPPPPHLPPPPDPPTIYGRD